jgi:hypothetical protein
MQGEKPEKHPSGAKARIDFAGFMYGLKPVPFTAKARTLHRDEFFRRL